MSALPTELAQSSPTPGATPHPAAAVAFEPLSLAEVEKRHILAVLEHCKGNRTHAAKMLQVSIRTLRNKLHQYNCSAQQHTDCTPPEIEEPQGRP